LHASILKTVESRLGHSIVECVSVPGGDVNQAFKLTFNSSSRVFLKYNTKPQHRLIIESEVKGLQLLDAKGVRIPRLIDSCFHDDFSALILDFIPINDIIPEEFAHQLSQLHSHTSSSYGLEYNNMIGSLYQSNSYTDTFIDFYVAHRIEPQIRLALEGGYLVSRNMDVFYKQVELSVPLEPPTLIHGDLWSGNVLFQNDGAYFIDPSVAYSHREFDLAMMRLFSGFDTRIFQLYNETNLLEQGWEDRSDIFQLYYLLVHLNLFGGSYLNGCQRIIKKYL